MPSLFACVAPVGTSEIFMLVVVLLPVALPWLRIRVSSIAIAKIELRQAERQAALPAHSALHRSELCLRVLVVWSCGCGCSYTLDFSPKIFKILASII